MPHPPAAGARPPNKRPTDAGENTSDSSPKVKMPRIERGAEDFSSVVKSKLQSYTRTGQACDRCKVRKIRCDALAEGCSHCANQNLACYVTDRVTGRTERRGYLQQLEREKSAMLNHIRELEKLVQSQGVEVRPWEYPNYSTTYPPATAYDGMGNPVDAPRDQWRQVGSLWVKGEIGERKPVSSGMTPYSLFQSRPTDNYLGIASDSAPLSSIKGTTLSILGTTIDITSFDAPDMDEPPPGTPIGSPLYNKSVMAFLQSVLNINPHLDNVDLPSRPDAFTYSEWYFVTISPFLPILHKPSFLQLLTRIYDDASFKASTAELVVVHMVFATIYFQYGIRNREEPEKHLQLNELSNKHYHWCLSKFFDLAISQTVTAVQALAMIVSHTRNFPKPGCSSTIAHFSLMKAIELNFHRAIKMPEGQTTLDYEIRKRSWWSILAVMVTLNGRLGRPMPITLQEFDVDFPIAVPDEYLGEHGISDLSKVGHCNYNVGIIAYRSVPLYIEMYSNIYAVRRDPRKYIEVVRELEEGMRSLVESLPEELMLDKCKPSDQIFALYTQAFILEYALCLRHPSASLTDDPKFCAENTRICEESAKKLVKVVGALVKIKSLDTTWYQLAVYIAAVFSTLVAHWERRFQSSPEEITELRADMSLWLTVIAEIGRLLAGSGTRLATDVRAIIERTVNWIEHDMHRKPDTPVSQPLIKQQSASPFQQGQVIKLPPSHQQAPPPSDPSHGQRNDAPPNGGTYYDATTGASSSSYPAIGYADQGGPSAPQPNGNIVGAAYDSAEGGQYMYSQAPPVASTTVPSVAPVVDQPTSPPNPLVAFASQAAQHVAGQAGEEWRTHQQLLPSNLPPNLPSNGGNTWQEWTAAIADSQDRYSANALLTLGSSRQVDIVTNTDHLNQGDTLSAANPHASQWPLLLFHDGSGP
ncbi:hypothetical protein B0T16DRAFT_70927 [Cercophora newfieldiana]|uniref:Zn(2)-C6 fungal-type domain-containing protein n=1 Tax=Cercophora newfieldiana TaxID=92897 RepID=A0AA39YUS8_9PEZI|nr:hypothetical protein B0T16DRAFT_70927 [Cercophora newfieldiana]